MEEIDIEYGKAESINVISDGAEISLKDGSAEYAKILECYLKVIESGHYCPAFGVSINRLTLDAKKRGKWIEFVFNKQYEFGGMPYEKLLIEVNKGFYGFNIIRYTAEHGYDGRCFYMDLVKGNMDELYNLLLDF